MGLTRGDLIPQGLGRSVFRFLAGGQVLILVLSSVLAPVACAQGLSMGADAVTSTSNSSLSSTGNRSNYLAQVGTVLPTDVVPLPAAQERMSFGENLQLRVLQRLPARFYFNSSVETSFRYETNVFQFPTKRKFLSQIFQTAPPPVFRLLSTENQQRIIRTIEMANNDDMVFRVLPNVSGGWTVTPRTRVFANYFMIRDSLFHNTRLNTVIHSIAYGAQQDIPITRRGNLQLEFQARELYQLHSQPVFDFLPALTFSYILTPRMVVFANTLLQLRGKRYFQAPTREIDPFYTFGGLYQRGAWSFSSTATFVQNFREPFRANASIPQNNYSWILDFELARRLLKQLPGLQAFIRAEPIYNFHSHNRPGLAGVDFRLFFGLRFAVSKPPLTAALEQIRQQLEEQESAPPPGKTPGEPKPSAFLMPYQLIAGSIQPMHGLLSPVMVQQASDVGVAPALTVLHPMANLSSHVPSGSPVELVSAPIKSITIVQHNEVVQSASDNLVAPVGLVTSLPEPVPASASSVSDEVRFVAMTPPESIGASEHDDVGRKITMRGQDEHSTVGAEPLRIASLESRPANNKKKSHRSARVVSRSSSLGKSSRRQPASLQMILVPPLPTVNPVARDNPFAGSGIDVSKPIMFNVVH
ncbi:MAG: hypothetical protein HY711_08000 [Candidatus Melainabacteria bacterium]|nr:hypothetical protein [Candidatus Melainabacteria bacterium]